MNSKIQKLIALSEILGGIFGVSFITLVPSAFKQYPTLIPGLSLIIISSIMSFIAGILLWKNRLLGIKLSIPIQALQILQIGINKFAYLLVIGLVISIKFAPNFKFDFGLKSMFQLVLLDKEQEFFIAFNLFSIYALNYLLKKYRLQQQQN